MIGRRIQTLMCWQAKNKLILRGSIARVPKAGLILAGHHGVVSSQLPQPRINSTPYSVQHHSAKQEMKPWASKLKGWNAMFQWNLSRSFSMLKYRHFTLLDIKITCSKSLRAWNLGNLLKVGSSKLLETFWRAKTGLLRKTRQSQAS